ncbi:MAG: 23S rRNA (pseudouridine(1915)-N(3))-methyltransferase RlmH [Bacillota bacterium]|nr:23S rRNA (pseudouridine(1915)-N(3))-methyltransferase RlmH [Bacillota bacterium]
MQRLTEFAKLGAVRRDCLDLRFVATDKEYGRDDPVKRMSSEDCARTIQSALNRGLSDIRVRVVSSVEEKAPHIEYILLVNQDISEELAEVLAAEQIYRAFMILHNRKYHK